MTTFQKFVKAFAILLSVVIIGAMLFGVIKAASIISKVSDATTSDGKVEDVESSSDVKKLRVKLFATNLIIVEGDDFDAETDNEDVVVKERWGTLIIEENSKSVIESAKKSELVLTIPRGFTFEKVDISTSAGNFSAETIKAEKIELSFGAGAVSVDSIYASEKIEIDGGAGKIEIRDGKMNNIDIDMGVGRLHLRGCLTGESEIDCGAGGMDLVLTGGEKLYTVSVDKGMGEASISGEAVEDDTTHGSGENSVSLGGGFGDMKVIFE